LETRVLVPYGRYPEPRNWIIGPAVITCYTYGWPIA